MKLTVFKGQYGFSVIAKNKQLKEGENKMYIQVQFPRGTEPEGERATIKINDAFFSMYKDKNNLAKPKLVIMDYTLAEDKQENTNNEVVEDFGFTDIPSDLPF